MPGTPLLYLEDNPALAVSRAVEVLTDNDGTVVFPTDTVYGLLAALDSAKAYQRIFEIKQRPLTQPLQILTLAQTQLAQDVRYALEQWPEHLAKFDSGQATVVLESSSISSLPSAVTQIQPGTVGLRLPRYQPLNDLLANMHHHAVWATSVNRTGEPPLTDAPSLAAACSTWLNPAELIIASRSTPRLDPSTVLQLTGQGLKQLRN